MFKDYADRGRAFDALRAMIEAHTTDDGIAFGTACWLVTAVR